jgi:excisionase family DNA binding protein
MENKEFLTVNEVAEILRCHHYTIRRLIWQKKLPYVKVGRRVRIARKALDEWVEKAMCEVLETTTKQTPDK